MNDKITKLEKEILLIKERNKRVEANKAWETSWFRVIVLAIGTYLLTFIFMSLFKIPDAWLNALISTTGYILSTFSLSFLKSWWINNRYNK